MFCGVILFNVILLIKLKQAFFSFLQRVFQFSFLHWRFILKDTHNFYLFFSLWFLIPFFFQSHFHLFLWWFYELVAIFCLFSYFSYWNTSSIIRRIGIFSGIRTRAFKWATNSTRTRGAKDGGEQLRTRRKVIRENYKQNKPDCEQWNINELQPLNSFVQWL